ncbi:MAG: helix-turn-helix domain-containing protein [Rhodospirillales bacterium]
MSGAILTRKQAGGRGLSELAGRGLANLEPLFTAQEVADYLRLDVSTTRRLFLDRPDVLKIGRLTARGGKRSYVTLRIPLSAVQRFIEERR